MFAFHTFQVPDGITIDIIRLGAFSTKTQAQHGVGSRPISMIVGGQSPKQCLLPLEQCPDRVHRKTLAEPARSGQEAMVTLINQRLGQRGPVDMAAVGFPQSDKGLHANWQTFEVTGPSRSHHGRFREDRRTDQQALSVCCAPHPFSLDKETARKCLHLLVLSHPFHAEVKSQFHDPRLSFCHASLLLWRSLICSRASCRNGR